MKQAAVENAVYVLAKNCREHEGICNGCPVFKNGRCQYEKYRPKDVRVKKWDLASKRRQDSSAKMRRSP